MFGFGALVETLAGHPTGRGFKETTSKGSRNGELNVYNPLYSQIWTTSPPELCFGLLNPLNLLGGLRGLFCRCGEELVPVRHGWRVENARNSHAPSEPAREGNLDSGHHRIFLLPPDQARSIHGRAQHRQFSLSASPARVRPRRKSPFPFSSSPS